MGIPPRNLPSPGPDSSYRYWAFISYSHRDEVWAHWLHTALETYRVPRKLVGSPARIGSETIPERILMALLELHRANLPWRGSVEQRDALLESSFQWLVAEFEEKGDPPGWQAGSESLSSISDGLTLHCHRRGIQSADHRSQGPALCGPRIDQLLVASVGN